MLVAGTPKTEEFKSRHCPAGCECPPHTHTRKPGGLWDRNQTTPRSWQQQQPQQHPASVSWAPVPTGLSQYLVKISTMFMKKYAKGGGEQGTQVNY